MCTRWFNRCSFISIWTIFSRIYNICRTYGIGLWNIPLEIKNLKYIIKLIISSIIVLFLIKIFIESAFLNILYGKAYFAVVMSRLITQTIMLPLQVVTIYFLEKALRPFAIKYLYKEERITIDEYFKKVNEIIEDTLWLAKK